MTAPLPPSFLPLPTVPTEPPGVLLAREYKRRLVTVESGNMLELRDRWLMAEYDLTPAMYDFADEIQRSQSVNPDFKITPAFLLASTAFARFTSQADVTLGAYVEYAAGRVDDFRQDYAAIGTEYGTAALEPLGLTPADPTPDPDPVTPSAPAAPETKRELRDLLAPAALFGILSVGTHLANLPAAAIARTAAIVDAIKNALGLGFDRILTAARTEPFRAYRDSQRSVWMENNIGWYMRVAEHDTRVCPACLMAEGETYLVKEALDEHPSGRCELVPMLTPKPPADWLYGERWFLQQDPGTQLEILGPGHFNAWQAGQYELGNIWKRTASREWGLTIQTRPLYELVPGLGRPPKPKTK